MNKEQEDLLKRLDDKFTAIDQNVNVHLEGLVWA